MENKELIAKQTMTNNYPKNNVVPEGWIEVSLGEIITLEYGRSLTALQRKHGNYKVWGSNGIVGTHNAFLIEGPVIIVGRKGSVGAVHYSHEKCWPIDTTYYINSIHSLSYRFVYYLLKYLNLSDLDTSTTIPGLNREMVYSRKILLPPFNEQNRIVEKIEELFSEIEYSEKTLSDIIKSLDVYWQSILKSTYAFVQDKKKLGDVSEIIMGQSPIGSTYNNKGLGTPLINGPMEFGKSSFSKTILSKWTTKPTKICNEGDIIICVRGSTTGRLNIAGFDSCIGRGVAAIQPNRHIYKDYLLYYLHYIEKNILEMGNGTTFPSISKDQLKEVIIPLCSYDMQIELARNLDSKYSIIENTRKGIEKMLIQTDIIKQSILHKAYAGELVPQNPNDEPAYKLLDKINLERLEFLQNKSKENKINPKIKKMERTKSALELLKEAKEPIPAKEVWQQSKHWGSIDNFYAELKSISELVEQTKSKTEILISLKK